MLTTSFTELTGCTVPIQQAGMGGIATPELATAVAHAGGLGMIAGVMVPPGVLAANLDALDADTRSYIGVNFLMPFLDEDSVAVAASRARVVEFFYGDPDARLVDRVHAGGALAFWQIGSLEEARAAAHAGCDAIVVQGAEAGGHVRGSAGLMSLLPRVLEEVRVPVIAAGGIGTPAAMAAALAAGAAAVRVGTLFVAARESAAHPDYVAALVGARAEDTVLTETFSVMWANAPHRVLRSCVAAAEGFEGDIVAVETLGEHEEPIPRFAPMTATVNVQGEIPAMALYAGESVDAVCAIRSAADIVTDLAASAETLLRRW